MRAGFRWFQQRIQHHPLMKMGIVVALLALIAFTLAVHVFGWDWTGFTAGPSKITKTPQGTTIEYSPGKNLWDWLQLLIVPLVLAIGGFWLNQIQKNREEEATKQRTKTEQDAAEKRAQTEREIALDNQQEAELQAYINKMSELLLEKHLRESQPEDEARTIARVRTITILFQLDARRIGYVFAFLREAGLMSTKSNSSIVSFSKADLNKINLSQASLFKANLSGAILSEANLSKTILGEADLSEAYLWKANLSGAILIAADLSDADLSDADLSEAQLWEANLSGANLNRANLSNASLSNASLSRAALFEATLSGANLSGADLSEVNLSGADLSGASLKDATGITTEALEKQARSLKGVTMPDGSKHS